MNINNLTISIDNIDLLEDISFNISEKNKIGLVGPNGCGKSTLLKTINGLISPTKGNINFNGKTFGYLKQEINHNDDNHKIIDYIKKEVGILEIEKKLHSLENNLNENNMDEYGEVLNSYILLDGYNFDDNLKYILSGLKLNHSLNDSIKILSGGEKIKILLALLLVQNTDYLFLDEPTNNLDIESLKWLENYLISSNKAMMIISHDEAFLNNVVNCIYEIRNKKIKEYKMSYEQYLIEKDNEYNRNYIEYVKANEEKSKLKKQLQKSKEWANKGNNKKAHNDNDKIANNFAKERTNNSNISKIAKTLEKIEIPNFEEKKPLNFFFNFDDNKGNKDIILDELICGYNNFQTSKINLLIPFGNKIMIFGGNGSGKTTLLKTLLGLIKPLNGKITIGNECKIGYISQDTLLENNEDSIFDYLTKNLEQFDTSYIFTLLDKFDIDYNDKNKKYKTLSPGQRTRINLVKLALDKINILILDEVTNHLDKEALDLIYELVKCYNGTIISISHNRKYNEILDPNISINIENGNIEYLKTLNKKSK
ncbi:MAG: ATP-binding cassette domain-containing protein [Bacilli bacterium]